MRIDFPYADVTALEISEKYPTQIFALPDLTPQTSASGAVKQAIETPIGSPRLRELIHGKKKRKIKEDYDQGIQRDSKETR